MLSLIFDLLTGDFWFLIPARIYDPFYVTSSSSTHFQRPSATMATDIRLLVHSVVYPTSNEQYTRDQQALSDLFKEPGKCYHSLLAHNFIS